MVSVKKEDIDQLIQDADISVETRFGKVTVVCCKLDNGFVITEAAGCVDPANYSQDTGFKICMERIENKLWELEGYALQKQFHENDMIHPITAPCKDMTFGMALEAMKGDHRVARKGWNGKGMYVFLAREVEFSTGADMSEFENREVEVSDTLVLKTAQSSLQPGWLATQSDMLADDWYIVE